MARHSCAAVIWCLLAGVAFAGQPDGGDTPVRTDVRDDSLPPFALARLGTVRPRHGGRVHSVFFTPDGTRVISAAGVWPGTYRQESRREIRVWDAASGRVVGQFGAQSPERGVDSLTPSADGKLLASLGWSPEVCIWDLASRSLLRQLDTGPGVGRTILAIAFAPDGKTLASAGADERIRLWDVATGKEIRNFGGGGRTITFSPDGKTLCNGQILWDLATGKERRRFPLEPHGRNAVAFSPDGNFLVVGGKEGEVILRETSSGREVRRFAPHRGGVFAVAFSPGGKALASSGGRCGSVRISEVATGREVCLLPEHGTPVDAVAFSPDGKRLATGCFDGGVRLWDVATGKPCPAGPGHRDPVACVAFTPDGKKLASGDGLTTRLWNLDRPERSQEWAVGNGKAEALAFSPDAKTLAWSEQNGTVRVREVAGGKDVWSVAGDDSGVPSLAFSPDGRALAAAGADTSVRIREAATGKEISQISGEVKGYEGVNEILFSPDGRLLAYAGRMRGVQIWDWRRRKLVRQVVDKGEWAVCSFSPDGKHLAVREQATPTALRSLETGKERLLLEELVPGKRSLAYSPDGRFLATTDSRDRSVRIWEVASWQEVLQLPRQDDSVTCVAFSPDGLRLASGSDDTTILIWDLTHPLAGGAARAGVAELWDHLAGADAASAYGAVCGLAGRPRESVPLLRTRLRPVPVVAAERLNTLIGQLDADEFGSRTRATEELAKLGEIAEASLRASLGRKPSPEARRRMDGLLERLDNPVPPAEVLRVVRALAVLERAGTPEARELLAELARGNPDARLTREAKASLERLAKIGGR